MIKFFSEKKLEHVIENFIETALLANGTKLSEFMAAFRKEGGENKQ